MRRRSRAWVRLAGNERTAPLTQGDFDGARPAVPPSHASCPMPSRGIDVDGAARRPAEHGAPSRIGDMTGNPRRLTKSGAVERIEGRLAPTSGIRRGDGLLFGDQRQAGTISEMRRIDASAA